VRQTGTRPACRLWTPRGRHISIGGRPALSSFTRKSSEDGFSPAAHASFSEKVHTRQIEIDIELLWESLGGDQREFTPSELAVLFFFRNPRQRPFPRFFRSLFGRHAVFFFSPQRDSIFCPETADQVGTERTRRDRQQVNEQARSHLAASMNHLVRSKTIEVTPEIAPLLERIHHWMRHKISDAAGNASGRDRRPGTSPRFGV